MIARLPPEVEQDEMMDRMDSARFEIFPNPVHHFILLRIRDKGSKYIEILLSEWHCL